MHCPFPVFYFVLLGVWFGVPSFAHNDHLAKSVLVESDTLYEVTLPYTAPENMLARLSMTSNNNTVGYVYLSSEKFGDGYEGLAGNTNLGTIRVWFPIVKGDKISLQSSGGIASYKVNVLKAQN